MDEQEVPITFSIKLSTGYEVEVDLTKTTRSWLPHLARAIIGERLLQDSKAAGEWRLDVIPEEIRYLLVTVPQEHKDMLLWEFIWEAVIRQYRRIEKRVEQPLSKVDGSEPDT